MYSHDWVLIIYAVYVPLLLCLYIFELAAIIKHRKKYFSTSFYKLFNVLAIVNIIATVIGTFLTRLSMYPIINSFYTSMTSSSWFITALYTCTYYSNCVSEFLGVILAFNRFTALYFPMRHDQFWNKAFAASIALCVAVGVAPVYQLSNNPSMFMETDELGYRWFFFISIDDPGEPSIWFNMVIATVFCNTASSILYGACLVRLTLFSATRNFTAERNFFLVGALTLIFSLPYMVAMLYCGITLSIPGAEVSFDSMVFLAFQVPWLLDLKYLTSAPMLLITNATIRKTIKQMLTRERMRGISTTATILSKGSRPQTTVI